MDTEPVGQAKTFPWSAKTESIGGSGGDGGGGGVVCYVKGYVKI